MAKNELTRTTAGLAGTLFDELDALREGTSTPQQARAKSAIANSIISIARLEMEYARFVASERTDGGNGKLPALALS